MTDAKHLDLKPCPFCGTSDALQLWDGRDQGQISSLLPQVEGNRFSICCNTNLAGCGAESGVRQSPDEAIVAWNNRPGAPEYPRRLQ